MRTVVVVGGGAAGIMSAIAASANGAKVVLLEKNPKLGKKLYITGKGRCNFSNNLPPSDFLTAVVTNPKFVLGAIHTLTPEATANYFEGLGCPTKTERGGRMFPLSDKSSDIITALTNDLQKNNVDIRLNTRVDAIIAKDACVCAVKAGGNTIPCDAVIVATGGLSYPLTGSNGDGFYFAESCGHTIVPPVAALVPLVPQTVQDAYDTPIPLTALPSLMGLSLKNVQLTAIAENGRTIREEFGEMLFTDNGLSGPIVLTLSSFVNRLRSGQYALRLDLKPALSPEQLDARIRRDFEGNLNKDFRNSLSDLLPSSMIPFVIKLSRIPADKKVNSITKTERASLTKVLKSMTFCNIATADISQAIVTSGGVNVKEINPKRMESLRTSGLFFAGEMLDVDALTGGFNIQLAFSTGYLAGTAASQQ